MPLPNNSRSQGNTQCAAVVSPFGPNPQVFWDAAALQACHEWFGVVGDSWPYVGPNSSPAVYV